MKNSFRRAKNKGEKGEDLEDRQILKYDDGSLALKWADPHILGRLRHRFATANNIKNRDGEGDSDEGFAREDSEGNGDGELRTWKLKLGDRAPG